MEAIIEQPQLSDYELERGKPMPTLNHSALQGDLLFALKLAYRQQYSFFPELNLTMPTRPDTVPDIAIYPELTVDYLHDISSMTEMPLTVIEIISPSPRNAGRSNGEILAKFERYFLAGVQSCWLVIPDFQAISVYSAIGIYQFFKADQTLTDPVTGIEFALSDVFSQLL